MAVLVRKKFEIRGVLGSAKLFVLLVWAQAEMLTHFGRLRAVGQELEAIKEREAPEGRLGKRRWRMLTTSAAVIVSRRRQRPKQKPRRMGSQSSRIIVICQNV